MENHRESRKRLRPWLERMINMGKCPGLMWENRDERTFRIPWRHFNNKEWVEEDSKIFREWAKYTGKYQDGDKAEYPVWKTRLRCALKKIPEIKEIPELHRTEDVNPYRVYKFVDIPVMKKALDHDTDSNSGFSHFGSSPNGRDYFEESQSSPPANFLNEKAAAQQSANVPTVVYDEEPRYDPSFKMIEKKEEHFLHQYPNYHQVYGNSTDQGLRMEYQNFHVKPQMISTMVEPATNFPNVHSAAALRPEILSHQVNTQAPPEHVQTDVNENMTSFPSDLMSVESTDLCQLANMELPPSICSNQSFGPSFGGSASSLNTEITSGYAPAMQLTVVYESPNIEVMRQNVMANGCRVFSGSVDINTNLNDKALEETLFGPKEATQLKLPNVDEFNVKPEHKQNIQDLLDKMERGIVLTYKEGDIYVQRLCRTRVFLTDGVSESALLERKNHAPTKAFDLSKFHNALQQHVSGAKKELPKPFFTLTIGQEIKKSHYQPLSRILIHIVVQHSYAARLLSNLNNASLTSGQYFSSDDNYDQIVDQVKKVSLT
ncbi:interferon regulatory factor 8-like [Physella acuta]|uniref:interferon regulatory factor 8-like n=1 Tax=Physella acuta TaxID=109671 RepID=UPI0027DBECE8|nr:interferon regulatory factor 8-like [Physella acuta]